jgi:pimeloyl-ACP methyl ester carboxylesterase
MHFNKGTGPPLIVIPGVQGRWEWVRPTLEQLQRRCRTISYSLCGDFGSGCRHDRTLGFENYLRQLDDLFERAHLERAAICGISYGGFVALRYAATRPERVSALIIASSPSPGWAPSPIQHAFISTPWRSTPKFIATSPMRMWPEIRAAFDHPLARLSFLARHGLRVAAAPMIPALMAGRVVEQQTLDFTPDTSRVQAPTLIVTGEPGLDRIVPVESTLRYLSMIPGARQAVIPRTGHLGLVTRPELFASVVSDFVERHAPQSTVPATGGRQAAAGDRRPLVAS